MDAIELLKDFPYTTRRDVLKKFDNCRTRSWIDCYVYGMQLLKEYPYATPKDLEEFFLIHDVPWMIDKIIPSISMTRETEKLKGREHVHARPLLHMHSVYLLPTDAGKDRPLAVYGSIWVKYRNIWTGEMMHVDVYNRSATDAYNISPSGCNLTLGYSHHTDLWMRLHGSTIGVDLYLKIGEEVVPFAQEEILVEDTTEGDFEEVRSKEFHGRLCSATLIYIAMPFAALCSVKVRFFGKEKGSVVNVSGKIFARYKNTYGNYNSEACVLFEKQNDFEPVNMNTSLSMSRTCLALPAYSSPELDLDLKDFNTNRELIKKTVEFIDWNGAYTSRHAVAVDDFAIIVEAHLSFYPLGGHHLASLADEDESCNESSSPPPPSSSSSSNNDNTWCPIHGEQSIPEQSDLVEFYSIFIGCKKLAGSKIFGTVEFSSDDNIQYLFKRTRNDAMGVEDSQKVLPISDVCRSFDEYCTLELKVNLNDVDGKYQSRGFATHMFDYSPPYNTQICSVFPGKNGFCALHYSIFPSACEANIKMFLEIKSDQLGDNNIYGSAIAQYSNFGYSTKLKRDYFRSVLFQRTQKDPVQLEKNMEVPLSRHVAVVPMGSSLIIEVDFCGMSLKDHEPCKAVFEIGRCCFTKETNDYKLDIKLTWSDGLHDGCSELENDKPQAKTT